MTLNDWRPILNSKYGDAVCEAARLEHTADGVIACLPIPDDDLLFEWHDDETPEWAYTALAFGTLAVLADNGFECTVTRYGIADWSGEYADGDTRPEAVRLAAMRAWSLTE